MRVQEFARSDLVAGLIPGRFSINSVQQRLSKSVILSISRRDQNVNYNLSGHLGVNMVDRGRVCQRPLYMGQIDSKNVRVSQTSSRKAGGRLAVMT